MELCMNRPGFLHSYVSGQIRVQSVDEVVVRMRPVKVHHSNLTRRVNASVRSPGQDDRASSPSQFAQGFFEFALHSSGFYLSLASEKVGAVVGKSQLVTCHCSSDLSRQEERLKPFLLYSSTNSKITISAESPMRGPSFSIRV